MPKAEKFIFIGAVLSSLSFVLPRRRQQVRRRNFGDRVEAPGRIRDTQSGSQQGSASPQLQLEKGQVQVKFLRRPEFPSLETMHAGRQLDRLNMKTPAISENSSDLSERTVTSGTTVLPLIGELVFRFLTSLQHPAVMVDNTVLEYSERGVEISGQERAKAFETVSVVSSERCKSDQLLQHLRTEPAKHAYSALDYHISANNGVHFAAEVAEFLEVEIPWSYKKLLLYSYVAQAIPGIKDVKNWDETMSLIGWSVAGAGLPLILAYASKKSSGSDGQSGVRGRLFIQEKTTQSAPPTSET